MVGVTVTTTLTLIPPSLRKLMAYNCLSAISSLLCQDLVAQLPINGMRSTKVILVIRKCLVTIGDGLKWVVRHPVLV